MSDVVAKCDNEKITKVKVASAEIIVSGKADKPYYEIKYYDLSKNEWCIGYGSYELKFVFQWLNECFELAKEPRECNSGLISKKKLIDSFNASINTGYETFSYDLIVEAINNQPQVQPIVRTPEEVTEMLNKISCPDCDKNSSHCHFSETECKNYWYEWLTKKEV